MGYLASIDAKKIYWGIGLAVLVVLFVFFAPLWMFKILIVAVSGACLVEFMNIALPKHPTSAPRMGIALGTLFSIMILFVRDPGLWTTGLAAILFVTFAYYLFAQHDLTLVLSQISITIFGCVYVACLFSYAGLLRGLDHGVFWIFVLAGCTFSADTSAYFVGHWIGRHKLAPRVSPGKTIEGLLGGVAGSILAAFACKAIFWHGFSNRDAVILGALVGLIGPLGDLSESLIKRSVGVKDSGNLIPGHGGLLDRLDAVFFTAPLVYYYAKLVYG